MQPVSVSGVVSGAVTVYVVPGVRPVIPTTPDAPGTGVPPVTVVPAGHSGAPVISEQEIVRLVVFWSSIVTLTGKHITIIIKASQQNIYEKQN